MKLKDILSEVKVEPTNSFNRFFKVEDDDGELYILSHIPSKEEFSLYIDSEDKIVSITMYYNSWGISGNIISVDNINSFIQYGNNVGQVLIDLVKCGFKLELGDDNPREGYYVINIDYDLFHSFTDMPRY